MTVTTLNSLAAALGLELRGSNIAASTPIQGMAVLAAAGTAHISFYHNPRYHADLRKTHAAAVILRAEDAAQCPVACLISPNPYLAYAKASQLFDRRPIEAATIHAAAHIDASAQVGVGVAIAANVVIGAGAIIGAGTIIGANCVIGPDCRVGTDCRLYPNVSLYHGVVMGDRCIVHSSVVLGSDGFGFARDGGRHHKIAQLGSLVIGNDVEIGAGTSIDRGALADTVIEDGVKIDNQVQIAHNVRIGSNTVICGCSAIAGSSSIGKNCTIAGAVGVVNHVNICDHVTITAMSLVNHDITEPGIYSSGTGIDVTGNWRRSIVRFRQLDDMWRRLLRLEKHQNKSPG